LSYVRTNVEGTLKRCSSRHRRGRFVARAYIYSEVYGTAKYIPIDENHPLRGPVTILSQQIGRGQIAESFHLAFSLPVVTLRPFNTYGPRTSGARDIRQLIHQALKGDDIRLGNLNQQGF